MTEVEELEKERNRERSTLLSQSRVVSAATPPVSSCCSAVILYSRRQLPVLR